MAVYRLTNRRFSRIWRRSKDYSSHEIRWLARKRHLEFQQKRDLIILTEPGTQKTVATFQEVAENEAVQPKERSRMLNALHFGLLLLLAFPVAAQTYQEHVVAAVLMGEAWGEGNLGMVAVAEVIHRRALDQGKTPLAVVTTKAAFACLNGASPRGLIQKFQTEDGYLAALNIAQTVCRNPENLPGITKMANHYATLARKPKWARRQPVVAVVGNHAFYRLASY